MKIHPFLLSLLVVSALAGAFVVGRFGQHPPANVQSPTTPLATSLPPQVIPTVPTHSAEIKTAKETLRVEGSATVLSIPSPERK